MENALICASNVLKIKSGNTRFFGSTFLSLMYLASGKFDGLVFKLPEENRRHIVSTVDLVMHEAKGKSSIINDYMIASNIDLHNELCRQMREKYY